VIVGAESDSAITAEGAAAPAAAGARTAGAGGRVAEALDPPVADAPAEGAAVVATPLASPAGKASLSLRTTGASTVDDADRTNSPNSWSLAMTTLLSTPSSLASS
jgi:hypothetical protein